jgi:hypothetical protein
VIEEKSVQQIGAILKCCLASRLLSAPSCGSTLPWLAQPDKAIAVSMVKRSFVITKLLKTGCTQGAAWYFLPPSFSLYAKTYLMIFAIME